MAAMNTTQILSESGTVFFSVTYIFAIKWSNNVGYKIDGNAVVLATEFTKICASVALCHTYVHKTPFPGPVRWGFAVNALLYMGTNLLTFYILESIDAGLNIVLGQHKILLIVGLSTVVFQRSYTKTQWTGCVMLMVGVAVTLMQKSGSYTAPPATLAMVLAQGLCSSFSGVWMEKMMKRTTPSAGATAFYDFLTDSLQMYAFSLPCYAALATTSISTHTLPALPTTLLVLNGACNGLFIGSVFKYFSAATRAFVQGATVLLVVWISVFFSGEAATVRLAAGTVLVVAGVSAFSLGGTHKQTPPKPQPLTKTSRAFNKADSAV